MKMSKLVGLRIKETPKDAVTSSHIFLLRGGYVRQVSAGIYSLLPIAKRITAKIETIIREEMNRLQVQEILMPVALPEELWQESGRAETVGPELLRFQDRNKKDMLLAMTHEEAVCQLIRTEVTSYKQLPIAVYQIQTKYRDEARPRAGLIRVREFTMKDAYSFHTDAKDLREFYNRMHEAYATIFKRIGLLEVLSFEADPGMMGGGVSHEFMAMADCGEDTLFVSPDGQYRANREVARSSLALHKEPVNPLEKVHTPATKTIADLSALLAVAPSHTAKAVFYKDVVSKTVIFANIRGDLDVNEAKLRNVLKVSELEAATDDEIRSIGAEPGFASIIGVDPKACRIVIDPSVSGSANLVVGANEKDFHYLHFNFARDFAYPEFCDIADIAMVREGDPCPVTAEPLQVRRGIEVGNIFELGTKYTESMKVQYLDQSGKKHPMIMGCYGIGIGRTLASVIEQCHDDYGPIWPVSIAPWHVHICPVNAKKEGVGEYAEALYRQFNDAGVETILDDRDEKAGFMFNDADLMGVPFRITVSPQTLEAGEVELKLRKESQKHRIPTDQILSHVQRLISEALD